MFRTLFILICSISGTIANRNFSDKHADHNSTNVISLKRIITANNKGIATDQVHNVTDSLHHQLQKAENASDVEKAALATDMGKVTPVENSVVNSSTARYTPSPHILLKIHRTITRSKDAVWATITLTFMCVLLLLAVAQSRMWKDYRGSEWQGVPLPSFNERVLFKDVVKHKMNYLKTIFKKKKTKGPSELESLLQPSESDEEDMIYLKKIIKKKKKKGLAELQSLLQSGESDEDETADIPAL